MKGSGYLVCEFVFDTNLLLWNRTLIWFLFSRCDTSHAIVDKRTTRHTRRSPVCGLWSWNLHTSRTSDLGQLSSKAASPNGPEPKVGGTHRLTARTSK